MPRAKREEYRVPPRGTFTGFRYENAETLHMTGKEWNELAQQHKFKWKKVGDPREKIRELCSVAVMFDSLV